MRLSHLIWCALLCSLSVAAQTPPTGAGAQQQESITAVELKGKAPVNPETLRVKLPRPQEAVLSNGMQVALLHDPKFPTFALQFVIKGGGLTDPQDRRGLAMMTASLLREGTKQRTSREIAEQLASLGASFSAGASPSSSESMANVSGLTEHFDETLRIVADVVRNATFPEAEVEKYKARFLSQLQYQRTLPNFMAQEELMRAVYADHPASFVVPQESVVRSITSEELTRYHRTHYAPNNIMVLAYGDLPLKTLVQRLEAAFGDWPKGEPTTLSLPKVSAPQKSRVLLVDRPGSVQTSLWLGALGIERKSEEYFAMLVMNYILGGGPASRLFTNLREDKGYTYGVSSSFTGSLFPGVVVTNTDVRTEVTQEALKELMGEIRRIMTEPVGKQELENAKRALIGRFALSLESPQALLSNLATQKIYGLPDDYWDEYPRHVESITPQDVQRVAREYWNPQKLQIVAVGDANVVRKVLDAYGTVEMPRS